ncbi:MAG: hypothetical protein HY558_05055, partial [Euryarchaeota archaeon]|nr:hypothetical protein [Euryarchaeota archaeon]
GGTFADPYSLATNSSTVAGVVQATSIYNTTVNGSLKNNILTPNYTQSFNVSENVSVNFSVGSDCSAEGNFSSAIVRIQLRRNQTGPEALEDCTPITNQTTGSFNCTWNTLLPSPRQGGTWDLLLTSNNTNISQYYYNNTTVLSKWITLVNPPPNQTLANNTTQTNVSVTPVAWGGSFNFSVHISDTAQDNVTCSLYFNNGTEIRFMGNGTVIGGTGTCRVIVGGDGSSSNFTGWDIGGAASSWWFRLDDGTPENTFNTTVVPGPNLTRDNLTLTLVAGNDTTVNRSGTQNVTLHVSLFDTNTGKPAPNVSVRFNVTLNGTGFDSGTLASSNFTGNVTLDFDPSGSYWVGPQMWRMTLEDGFYNDSNTTNYSLTVTGVLLTQISAINSGSVNERAFLRGTDIVVEAEVREDNNSFRSNINTTFNVTNVGGSLLNCPLTAQSGGTYQCTFNSSDRPTRHYNLTLSVNDTYFPNNTTQHNGSTGACPVNQCFAFYLETRPRLTNATVNKTLGGWGENWSLTATVDDEDLDPTNQVNLTIRRTGQTTWIPDGTNVILTNTTTVTGPQNKNVTFYYSTPDSIGGARIGDWEFMFQASDDPDVPNTAGTTYHNNSSIGNFTLEADDVVFRNRDNTSVSATKFLDHSVYRNDAGADNLTTFPTQNMSIRIFDTDRGDYLVDGANMRVYLTEDYTNNNFRNATTLQTDSVTFGLKGAVNFTFNPDCNYATGQQRWVLGTLDFGGNPTDLWYKNVNTSNLTHPSFTRIFSTNFTSNITAPTGVAYERGVETPTYTGTLQDECFTEKGAVPFATTTFKASKSGQSDQTCSGTGDGTGNFSCTASLSSYAFSNWSLRLEATDTFHPITAGLTAGETRSNALFVADRPALSLGLVNSQSNITAPWGTLLTFAVTLTDQDGNRVNVTVEKAPDNANWSFVTNTTMIPEALGKTKFLNEPVTMTPLRLTCSDIGYNYFRINATDNATYGRTIGYSRTLNTSGAGYILNFTLTPDTASGITLVEGDGAQVRRNNSTNLTVRVNDATTGTNASAGHRVKFFITRDRNTFDVELEALTNQSGYATVNYTPNDTSQAAAQAWKAGVGYNDTAIYGGQTCYNAFNSSNATLHVIGRLTPTITAPATGTLVRRGDNVSLNATVRDEFNATVTDATLLWYNSTTTLASRQWNTSNTTYAANWTVNSTYGRGATTLTANASLYNSSREFDPGYASLNLTVFGWTRVGAISPANNTSLLASSTYTPVNCSVQDANLTVAVDDTYPVEFYRSYEGGAWVLESTNTTFNGTATWNWSTADRLPGNYSLSCVIRDNATLYYNASGQSTNNTSVVLSRPLRVLDVKFYDPAGTELSPPRVYRNNSLFPSIANFTARIQDSDIGPADNSTVGFYNNTSLIGTCTTNATGWCATPVTFNPNDTMEPQNHTLYVNATNISLQPSNTTTTGIYVNGTLSVTILSPVNGTLWSTTDTRRLVLIVTDELGVNHTLNASLNSTWLAETGRCAYADTNASRLTNASGFLVNGTTTYWRPGESACSPGLLNLTGRAVREFYDANQTYLNVRVTTLTRVQWQNSTPIGSQTFAQNTTAMPYPNPALNTTFAFWIGCQVIDSENQPVPSYKVNLSYRYTGETINGSSTEVWLLNDSLTLTSPVEERGMVKYNFTPLLHNLSEPSNDRKGPIEFHCNIGDKAEANAQANVTDINATIYLRDQTAPFLLNSSVSPNSSLEARNQSTSALTILANLTDNYLNASNLSLQSLPNASQDDNENINFGQPLGNRTGVFAKSNLACSNWLDSTGTVMSSPGAIAASTAPYFNRMSASGDRNDTQLDSYNTTCLPVQNGTYTINIVARDWRNDNGQFNTLDTQIDSFLVLGKTGGSLGQNQSFNLTNVTSLDSESRTFNITFTNTGAAFAYDVTMNVTEVNLGVCTNPNNIPGSCADKGSADNINFTGNTTNGTGILNTVTYGSTSPRTCGQMAPGATCTFPIRATIRESTLGLNYIRGYVSWKDPQNNTVGASRTTVINHTLMNVRANRTLEITPRVEETKEHNTTTAYTFTVRNIGNIFARNAKFKVYQDANLPPANKCQTSGGCYVSITNSTGGAIPASGSDLGALDVLAPQNITIRVDTGRGTKAGTYNWTVEVSADQANSGFNDMIFTIPTNRSWTLTPVNFASGDTLTVSVNTSWSQDSTFRYYMVVENTGNIPLNFEAVRSVSPPVLGEVVVGPAGWNVLCTQQASDINISCADALSEPTPTSSQAANITLGFESTGVPENTYNATFIFARIDDPTDSRSLALRLNVTNLAPTITNLTNTTNLSGYVEIYQNVTVNATVVDPSGISRVWLNVTLPNSTVEQTFAGNPTGNNYTIRYTYAHPENGTLTLAFCANDTTNLVSCTSAGTIRAENQTTPTPTISLTPSNA